MGIKVSAAELKSIIHEVETGLGDLLKSETAKLQKASEEEESAPAESAPAESAPAESAPAESAPAESAPAEDGGSPEGAPAEEGSGDLPQDESQVLEQPDHDALCQEMAAMPPEHVKAVYLAAKAVLMQGAQSAPVAAPPAAAPSAPPMGKDEEPMEAAKAEVGATKWEKAEAKSNPANGGERLGKSEVALSKAQDQIEALQAQVAGLLKVAEMTVGMPRQKAITGVSFVPKSDDIMKGEKPVLSRPEALKKLAEKACDQKLSKSDREAINSFTLNVKADLSAVAHLLQ